jgi:class 3 adenylate cyclase
MGRTIVMSSAVARHCGDGLVSLGRHELRGFRATEEVFGLADESPAIAATGTGGAA